MLRTRWKKLHSYMNSNLRRYLGYAAGEIILVIAGILIALQIDGWNDDRKTEQELDIQLQGVAENIAEDLVAVTRLKRHRNVSITNASRLASMTGPSKNANQWATAEYVEFARSLIADRQAPVYLVPATGAYEALESSGNATHIRNDRLRRDLHSYYSTVERIVVTEREMNGILRDILIKFQTETTKGLPRFILEEPLIAWLPNVGWEVEDAQKYQDQYLQILTSPITWALIRADSNQLLLKEYERLLTLGDSLIAQIDAYRNGEIAPQTISSPPSDVPTGPSVVFRDGLIELHTFAVRAAPPTSDFLSDMNDMTFDGQSLRINYPGGNEWQFVYALVGPIEISMHKHALDFSRFDRIRLELKRHEGCDNLRLILKDTEDPDDGSQISLKLDLSDEWEIYDFELSRFSDADLSILNVAAGFLMDDTPCDFSIGDVHFLEPGEPVPDAQTQL